MTPSRREKTRPTKLLDLEMQALGFLRRNQGALLELLTRTQSVFTAAEAELLLDRVNWDDPVSGELNKPLPRDLKTAIVAKLLQAAEVVALEPGDGGEAIYTTAAMRAVETEMLEITLRRAALRRPFMAEADRDALVAHFKSNPAAYFMDGDDEQVAALLHLIDDAELTLLSGPPGAGKGEMIALLCRAYEKSPRHSLGVIVTAPTDKMTAQIAKTANVPAARLDELIERLKSGHADVQPGGLVILDEAGMVGSRQMRDFLVECERLDLRVALVGDDRQIAPLEAGQPFRLFREKLPEAKLSKFFRQRHETDREAARELRDDHPEAALSSYVARGLVKWARDPEAAIEAAANDYAEWRAKRKHEGEYAVILTPDCASADQANRVVRETMKRNGQLQHERVIKSRDGDLALAVGDPIILDETLVFQEGAETRTLYRGTTATVHRLGPNYLAFRTDGKKGQDFVISLDHRQPALRHAYALDLRTSQGITVERVIMAITGPVDSGMGLVGLSRHLEKATLTVARSLYPDLAALRSALGRRTVKPMSLEYQAKKPVPPAPSAP